jgi:Xaa-Pro dipeptidase
VNGGLAGILLTDQVSLYYLFGYDQIGYWVFQAVYLPAEGPAIAICRAPDAGMIRATGMVPDVRVWMDDASVGPGELVLQVLRDAGVTSADTVGIEIRNHCLLPSYYQAVLDATSGHVHWHDASDIVTELRIVKDAAEISHFRESAACLAAAFEAAREQIGAGVRETDVHRAITNCMYELGCDPPAIPPPIASGPRTITQTHGAATTRRIQDGELVVIEIGASVRRYHAVGAMTYSVGAGTDEARSTHAAMVRTLEAGLDYFHPGTPIAQVAASIHAQLEANGLKSRAGRHVGYGTGIGYPPTWLEPTRIKLTEPRILTPGMTFFYFLGIPLSDGTSMYLGEPILITETGVERFAPVDYREWQL